MPGLNLEKLAWDGNLEEVSRYLLEVYSKPGTPPSEAESPASFYTPYQFLLPILQSLYHKLVDAAGEKEGLKISEPKMDVVKTGNLKAVNPESREKALSTSLRAVAYYSWEPGNRLFLVRRVFPTYFDFLSISHIPEGWGASSLMLEQLKEQLKIGVHGVHNGSFYAAFNIDNPDHIRYHLPYIAEQKRLKYQWVVVLPVFQRTKARSERDMLGTLVFFLGSGDDLVPAQGSEVDNNLKLFFNRLCGTLSEVITAHNHFLASAALAQSLAQSWKEARQRATKAAVVARVILHCHGQQCGPGCKVLDLASSEFLKALEGPEYYVLRDDSDEKHEAVFLVAARPSIQPSEFQRNLLRLLTDRLSQQNIACEVTINDHGEQKKDVFLIKSDQGWATNDV